MTRAEQDPISADRPTQGRAAPPSTGAGAETIDLARLDRRAGTDVDNRISVDAVALLDELPTAVALVDASGQVLWANRTTERLSGWALDEMVGSNMLDHIDVSWNPMVLESIAFALDHGGVRLPTLYRMRTRNGPPQIVEVTANNQLENPLIGGLLVQLRIWDEQEMYDQILESLGQGDPLDRTLSLVIDLAARSTVDAQAAVYVRSDADGPLVRSTQSPSAPAIPDVVAGSVHADASAPWTRAAAIGSPVITEAIDSLPAAIRRPAEIAGFRACWAYPVSRPGTSEAVAVLVLWRRQTGPPEPTIDWTIHRLVRLVSLAMTSAERQAMLEHAAHHDLLTDLPNRAHFFERVGQALAEATGRVAVLYLDLDGFKQVNDAHGHASGDEVLEEVATRLICATRSTDMVARLGGDEFAVLCPGASDEGLAATATRLINSISDPIGTGATAFLVGASVGIAVAEPGSSTADVLIDRADAALLAVKAEGKGSYRFG